MADNIGDQNEFLAAHEDVFPVKNVFREDVVTNGDDSENMLANAPEEKDGFYMVPKTVE